MKKVIVTFATRPLALRIGKLLEDKCAILWATSEEVPSFMKSNYIQVPTGVNPTFAHEMLKIALDQQVDYILPLGIREIESFGESKVLFEEYGITVLCPDLAELEGVNVLQNPARDLDLMILENGKNLLDSQQYENNISGLGILSDSGEEFVLAIID